MMPTHHLEPLMQQAERRAVVTVLRAHPEWTLGHLFGHLEQGGARANLLRNLTFGELLADPGPATNGLPPDGGPPINRVRLAAARRAAGAEFDEHVQSVLAEAGGRAVAAAYLRARVGGPRWKLQDSFRRLTAAGAIERSGTTSGTRYRVLIQAESGK